MIDAIDLDFPGLNASNTLLLIPDITLRKRPKMSSLTLSELLPGLPAFYAGTTTTKDRAAEKELKETESPKAQSIASGEQQSLADVLPGMRFILPAYLGTVAALVKPAVKDSAKTLGEVSAQKQSLAAVLPGLCKIMPAYTGKPSSALVASKDISKPENSSTRSSAPITQKPERQLSLAELLPGLAIAMPAYTGKAPSTADSTADSKTDSSVQVENVATITSTTSSTPSRQPSLAELLPGLPAFYVGSAVAEISVPTGKLERKPTLAEVLPGLLMIMPAYVGKASAADSGSPATHTAASDKAEGSKHRQPSLAELLPGLPPFYAGRA